ncbi:hypothetical protein H0H81_002281 [Sphagnurus paluster]|uniref:C2H2-type domain-containing protein n=1 Tax=Sphagnurus paluster TaxID=117069 RepID=A0A9P7FX85_9AGAR|nr:hypothetical protein H0H81_002281 [Sphagnurus paluster]
MARFCQPCARSFANDEALRQHLQSSGTEHPFCDRSWCGKRFGSESARDAHIKDKHPPTFDCVVCGKQFAELSRLESHYRGSPRHPNCGFKDNFDLAEHIESSCMASESREDDIALEMVTETMKNSDERNSPSRLLQGHTLETGEYEASDSVISSGLTVPKSPSGKRRVDALPCPSPIIARAWNEIDNVIPLLPTTPRLIGVPTLDKAPEIDPLHPTQSSPTSNINQGRNHRNNSELQLFNPSGRWQLASPSDSIFRSQNLCQDKKVFEQEPTTSLPEWRSRVLLSPLPEDARGERQGSTAAKYGIQREGTSSFFNRDRLWPTTTFFPPPIGTPVSTPSVTSTPRKTGFLAPRRPSAQAIPTPTHTMIDWKELMGGNTYSLGRSRSNRSDDVSSTQAVGTPVSPWSGQHSNGVVSGGKDGISPSSSNSGRTLNNVLNSPTGLAPLPSISPIATTPTDVPLSSTFYPNRPVWSSYVDSPFQLATDTRLPDSPSTASLTSVVSPKSSTQGSDDLQMNILSLPLPDSPSVSQLTSPASAIGEVRSMTPLGHDLDEDPLTPDLEHCHDDHDITCVVKNYCDKEPLKPAVKDDLEGLQHLSMLKEPDELSSADVPL